MSDLYSEATRHDYIKVPRYLIFLGGGLVAVLFVAMGLWMTVTTEEAVVEPLETVEEAEFRRIAARVAAVRAVAPDPALSERRPIRARLTREIASGRELAEAIAAVWAEVGLEEGASVLAVEETAEFALEIKPPNWDRSTTTRLSSVERYLEQATRGERHFGGMGPGLPGWVPAYPGARGVLHSSQGSASIPGYSAFVVDAGAEEVVDWYQQVADFMNQQDADGSAQAAGMVETVRMQPDAGVRERFAMKWRDRFLLLVATEDELRSSLFILFFSRGDA